MSPLEMSFRVLLAMMIGSVIGWERETSNRPAGLRTHMLVAIGSAVIMLMGELSLYRYENLTTMDPTRLGAQVISGIGFLGAGTILRDGVTIRGLTTAASVWSVACLGLAAGGGFYETAVAGTVAIMLTLTIFEYLEKHVRKRRAKGLILEVECSNLTEVLLRLKRTVPGYDIALNDWEVVEELRGDETKYILTARLVFNKQRKKIDSEGFLSEMRAWKGVYALTAEEYQK